MQADAPNSFSLSDAHCQECGYSLRGLTSDRCPECGYSLVEARSRESQIPWVHREDIGLLRSYWRTVRMVMFDHKRFCRELARPVSYAHAQRFRQMTIMLAYLPILAASVFVFVVDRSGDFKILSDIFGPVFPFAVAQGCVVALLVTITAVPGYFYHPKGMSVMLQNRAIAMSYYAAAALAWMFLPALSFVLGYVLRPVHENTGVLFLLIAMLVPFGLLTAWWLDLIHIALRVMPHLKNRVVALAVGIPLAWLSLGTVTLVGLSLVVLYVYVVFASLS